MTDATSKYPELCILRKNPKAKTRKCLRCDVCFESFGSQHRICNDCKIINSKLGENDVGVYDFCCKSSLRKRNENS